MNATRRALGAICFLVLALGGTDLSPAQASAPPHTAATPVVLTGSVSNGTAGGTLPGQLSVTGTEVDAQASSVVAVKAAPVAADGTFRIEGLPGNSGDHFAVSTDYKGVTYVTEGQPTAPIIAKIYETTSDDSVISIPSDTLTIFLGKANTYDALQLLRVHNSSDRTYVGKPDPSGTGLLQALELPVPKGIANFAVESGLTTSGLSVAADGQVASADPVLPGDESVSYLYEVSVARSGWPLSRPVLYPTARVAILLDPALNATGPGLKFAKTVPVAKQQYRDFEGGALAPGTALTASITPVSSRSNTLWWGLFAILSVAVIGALVVPRLLSKRRDRAAAAEKLAAREAEEALERESQAAQAAEQAAPKGAAKAVPGAAPKAAPGAAPKAAPGAAPKAAPGAAPGAAPDAARTSAPGAAAVDQPGEPNDEHAQTAAAGALAAERQALIEQIAALDEAHDAAQGSWPDGAARAGGTATTTPEAGAGDPGAASQARYAAERARLKQRLVALGAGETGETPASTPAADPR